MKELLSAVLLVTIMGFAPHSYSNVIYHFYGYGNCEASGCDVQAKGTLWLDGSYVPGTQASNHFVNWAFSNYSTGVHYNLKDSRLPNHMGFDAILPEQSGLGSMWLDYPGEDTAVWIGNWLEGTANTGVASWNHGYIEANDMFSPQGNAFQLYLSQVPAAGSFHKWVRVSGSVPEPSPLALMALGLLALRRLGRQARQGAS